MPAQDPPKLIPRSLSGASLHALLGAIVTSCLAIQCGASIDDDGPRDPDQTSGEDDDSNGGDDDDTPDGTVSPTGTPANPICAENGWPRLVVGLNPTEPVDYLAHYRLIQLNEVPTLLDEEGTPCAPASGSPCAGDGEPPVSGFDRSVDLRIHEYLVFRRGDSVGHILNQTQLLDFLGTIDTPNEAALVLWSADRPVECANLYLQPDGSYTGSGSYTTDICPVTHQRVNLTVSQAGAVGQTDVGEPDVTNACVGRRPTGLSAVQRCPDESLDSPEQGNAVGAYFATVARLESAAVIAFGLLERELIAHGAPTELLQRVRAAAHDEMRHAAHMTALATRFGARVEPAAAPAGPVRPLLEIALENAKEGCVRELYGAASAVWQGALG